MTIKLICCCVGIQPVIYNNNDNNIPSALTVQTYSHSSYVLTLVFKPRDLYYQINDLIELTLCSLLMRDI